jgi:hypothetical protein
LYRVSAVKSGMHDRAKRELGDAIAFTQARRRPLLEAHDERQPARDARFAAARRRYQENLGTHLHEYSWYRRTLVGRRVHPLPALTEIRPDCDATLTTRVAASITLVLTAKHRKARTEATS